MTARMNRTDGFVRETLIVREGKILIGVNEVDEVVRDARLLFRSWLGCANVHPAVHLARVRRDDLPAKLLPQLERERRFADGGRTEDGDERLGGCHKLNLHQGVEICNKLGVGLPTPSELL